MNVPGLYLSFSRCHRERYEASPLLYKSAWCHIDVDLSDPAVERPSFCRGCILAAMSSYRQDNKGDGWGTVYTLKDGRAQVILEAAGKYRFIKEFIKVSDRAPQLLGRG